MTRATKPSYRRFYVMLKNLIKSRMLQNDRVVCAFLYHKAMSIEEDFITYNLSALLQEMASRDDNLAENSTASIAKFEVSFQVSLNTNKQACLHEQVWPFRPFALPLL